MSSAFGKRKKSDGVDFYGCTMSDHELPAMKRFLGAYRNPRVRLFRRQIIDRTVQDIHTGRVFQVKAGIKGQADAYAFVKRQKPCYGANGTVVGWTVDQGASTQIEIEFKGARTIITEEQQTWRAFCQEWGVPYIILRVDTDGENETIAYWTRILDKLVNTL